MPEIAYTDRGPRTGPQVVLVHGLGVSGRTMAPLARLLEPTHRVVVPDLPGAGGSGRPHPALGIEALAVALEGLVDRLGLDRPLLLGSSMGAQVVTEMAARRPDRTRGVVLVGPVVDPAAPSAAAQGGRLSRDTVREPPWLAALVLRDYWRTGPRSFTGLLRHMLDYPLADRLAEVAAPVVVVRGGADAIAGRDFVHALAARAPRGRVREVAGARHLTMSTHPEAVAAVCREVTG